MLHVTNDDVMARSLVEAGLVRPLSLESAENVVPDQVIAWRDVLYEGPVRAKLSPVNLAAERCRYQASQGWNVYLFARQAMAKRDAALVDAEKHDETVFWFGHHLADQLRLLQTLDRLAFRRSVSTRYSWIVIDRHPDQESFLGLESLSPDRLAALFAERRPVPDEAFSEARRVWNAFIAADPRDLLARTLTPPTVFPFVGAALRRLLAEYPSVRSGLSGSERLILQALETFPRTPIDIFAAVQAKEAVPFLDEPRVWNRLDWLATGAHPLIQPVGGANWVSPVTRLDAPEDPDLEAFAAQELELTENGCAVLADHADWTALKSPDRWIGGVHIHDATSWRWDVSGERLVASGPREIAQ